MANLPENTSYTPTGSTSPMSGLGNIQKLLQQNAAKTSADSFKTALLNHYTPEQFSSIMGSPILPSSILDNGITPNHPVAPQIPGNNPPPSYERFLLPDRRNNWALPSGATPVTDWPVSEGGQPGQQYANAGPDTQAYLRNWPETMGGGQYVVDPSQPGELIKSGRVAVNDSINPGAKQKILGKLSPKDYQVDHIVPLWLGGADTLQNLQILDNITHEKKTAVQAVPLTLLANGKINLDEAKLMALTWKDKDASGLPNADANGYVPIDIAEKYQQKWKDDMTNPSLWKYFGQSFKENMQDFGKGWLPNPIREFAKGLVGGGTAGIIPGTGTSPDEGVLSTIGNTAGNIVGTITGMGLASKGLSSLFGGAKALMGFTRGAQIADEALQSAGLATDIGDLTAKGITSKVRTETFKKMASSAGLLSLWGQIGLTGREATGQQDFELKNHMTQFFSDVAFGSLLGAAGQNVKGYAAVGLGTAALSLIEGDQIVPALKNAALMTALHTMGYQKGLIDPKVRMGSDEAYKMASNTMNQYLGDAFPNVKKGQPVPEVLKLDIPKVEQMRQDFQAQYPNDQVAQRFGPITNEAEAIDFGTEVARRRFGNLIAKGDGTISPEQIEKEIQRITTSANQMKNQTLPMAEREAKEYKDLLSMGEKLRPQVNSSQVKVARNKMDILNKIPVQIPTKVYDNPNGVTFPAGKGGITGYGDNIDTEAKLNIDEFAKDVRNEKFDGKIYIPKTDQTTAGISKLINTEFATAGEAEPIDSPESTLRAFVRTNDGEFKPVGFIPEEKSYTKKENLNKTYYEITNRLRHTIETATSPSEVKRLLERDKAQIFISEEDAQKLFDRKATLKDMPDEELYSILKPLNAYDKLDQNLNNKTMYNKMNELGIDYVVVDPYKAWEINGPRPRRNPNNPYLNIDITDQDWLRSMDMKNNESVTSTQKTVRNIVNKNKPVETALSVPTVAPTAPTETPQTPETNITSPDLQTPPDTSTVETNAPTEQLLPAEKWKNIDKTITPKKDTVIKLTDDFFNDIVHDIEYRKVKPSSANDIENVYLNIVEAFKRKNPGLPEADFKNAINDAKSRARSYVQDLVDDTYRGTKYFGTEDVYKRSPLKENTNVLVKRYNELQAKEKKSSNEEGQFSPDLTKSEKVEMGDVKNKIENYVELDKQSKSIQDKAKSENRDLTKEENKQIYDLSKKKFTLTQDYLGPKDRSLVLANKFDLKLQDPNDAGIRYLSLDKYGDPMFSDEYKAAHPNSGRPSDVYGSFLENEMKVYRDTLSTASRDWSKGIQQMKTSKKPYAKGFASAVDEALKEKYDIRDKSGNTKYGWEGSWKLNSILKNLKPWFHTTNQEGVLESQPFRRTASENTNQSYAKIKKNVAEADAKTRAITAKAQDERFLAMNNGAKKPVLPGGMRVKDLNQINDVSEDLTPFDMMTNGIISSEIRKKLIDQYNNLREEMTPDKRTETRIADDGNKVLGTEDEMKKLYAQIMELSSNIPEQTKNWKVGGKITLRDNGEPTFEEGVADGLRVAGNIFKMKKSPGFVNFEKIKKMLVDSKPDGKGGPYDGKGGMFGDAMNSLGNLFSSTTTYTRPPDSSSNIDYPKLRESIKFNETNLKKNPYSFKQPSGTKKYGNANGAYQITDAEIKERSKQFTGQQLTPQQFLSNPTNQDKYMDGKIKYLESIGLTTPQDIIAAHRGGFSDTSTAAKSKRLQERVNYVNAAMKFYNKHPELADQISSR